MGSPAVVVKDLYVKYAVSVEWILKGLSLNVNRGEMLILMGPSGCGKSTLLYVIAGLIPWVVPGEVDGEVSVEGLNVTDLGYSKLAGVVGIVYQNPEMQVITRSVKEELAMVPENLGLPKDEVVSRVEWVADALDLHRYLDRDPQSLSGGEKQLIAIASVLTMKPRVLLLDEPTSMLDHKGTSLVLEVVSQLKREHGLTIIAAEHRVEWAVEVADRIAVMHEGRIVLIGEPQDVFSRVDEIEKYGVRPPGVSEVVYCLRRKSIEIPVPVRLKEAVEVFRL
ncbi:MAG: energy-coupling factor ABC transporter ATP-binding protein [Thermofilaceae archaeon]|nr:energy-coupling factor ABC transporter ATP-binding protein [Thermofilaceae archaeon]MCX8180265.1 energy-coupling factor ABC transporter ATP-binding protein [Thermofilaceae archaeon]MDW8004015.1 ABC transporter ATP-binding protein [Thermofilaceae archaeon]